MGGKLIEGYGCFLVGQVMKTIKIQRQSPSHRLPTRQNPHQNAARGNHSHGSQNAWPMKFWNACGTPPKSTRPPVLSKEGFSLVGDLLRR